MPVPPEVAKKIKDMRARLQETERLAGIKPVGRPPKETADPQLPAPSEPAQALATLSTDAARANQVYRWIIQGATEFDIREAMQQAWPDASHADILLSAIEKIRESNEIDPQTVKGFCFEATRELYRRLVEIGDFPGALRALKQLAQFARHP